MEPGVSGAHAIAKPIATDRPAKPSAPSRLTVETRTDLALPPDDADALDELIASRPEVGVFLSPAWLSGYFADPADGGEPLLVLVRDEHCLRGLMPIAIRRTNTHVRVRLLGGGLGSDRVDLLASPRFETACADAIVTWLGQAFGPSAFIFELRDVPADSALWGAIHRANADRTRRLVLQPREHYTLPYLDLTESAAPVKSLAKHQRWLERRGRLRVETLQDPGEVLAAFDALAAFLHARWRGRGDGSALDQPRLHGFHRHVIPLLLRDRYLRMMRVSSDMRTIAVFYGLAVGKWRGYYLAGYDREWAGRIHLGQLTLATAIDAAVKEGAAAFDFLKGVEAVKYLWPVRERSSMDADLFSEHTASQMIRAARATREVAGAFVKSARCAFSTASHR
jgi:CelD/BcsL family acetyltransferase involved in cellulose biosynthesis